MKRVSIFLSVFIVLTIALSVTASPTLAEGSPVDKVAAYVANGGGTLHLVPDVQVQPFNFADYPEAFDTGLATWDNDMIDTEKVADGINGEGVYVAVIDTGLVKNWRDYFPEERIATELGRSFIDVGVMQGEKTPDEKYTPNVIESRDFTGEHPHGTHVSSTVIGYSIRGTFVPGVAPHATIIPVKVLEMYNGIQATFGTDAAVAAGIEYVAGLAEAMPDSSFVINMSLGSLSDISDIEAAAVDHAIAAGVIVVASAGNDGTYGMGSPGSYPPVISVGASGWAFDSNTCTGEWVAGCAISGAFWYQDVPEDASAAVSYITNFSSRERPDWWKYQELDVVAPGSWVVGPYPVGTGQSHLPWWASGNGYGVGGQYYFVGGTSMASPHVAGVAALMLQANPSLTQTDVEAILRSTADALPFAGTQAVINPNVGYTIVSWGLDGYDAVGYGLLQADAAVDAAIP